MAYADLITRNLQELGVLSYRPVFEEQRQGHRNNNVA